MCEYVCQVVNYIFSKHNIYLMWINVRKRIEPCLVTTTSMTALNRLKLLVVARR